MNSQHNFLFLMDPYETLNLKTETSLLLMETLLAQGQAVYWLEAEGLYLQQNNPRGLIKSVSGISPFSLGKAEDRCLNDFDALLVRLDPPFDSRYLHITYILDHLSPEVRQFNSTAAMRNLNEKLLPLRWPELTPPTITAMGVEPIKAFLAEHGEIVVKPLDDCSGRGVVRLRNHNNENIEPTLKRLLKDKQGNPRYLLAQKFLPAVNNGDKRVYLVNGKPLGWVNRIPRKGEFLANIHQGAHCEATQLTTKERRAIKKIAPFLQQQGVLFVGVDFIDELITEINITSPSAIRQINEVMGIKVHLLLVDAMLQQLGTPKATPESRSCFTSMLRSLMAREPCCWPKACC